MIRTTAVLWILGFTYAMAQVWGNPDYVNANPANTENANNAFPAIATDGHKWITVWGTEEPVVGINTNKGTDMDIVFSISTTGYTWTKEDIVSNLATIDTGGDSNPDIVYSGENVWVVVWETTESQLPTPHGTDDDIFYCFSTNNGVSWNNTNLLNNYFLNDGKNDALPRIACIDIYCVTVWYYQIVKSTPGNSSEVLFSLSSDRGFTWSYPQSIKAPDSAPDTNPAIAVNTNGIFVVSWLFGTVSNNQILVATSNNNGGTWSILNPISQNTETQPPSISTLGNAEFLISWTTSSSSSPLYSHSANNGDTWSTPQTLGKDISTSVGGTVSDIVVVGDPRGIWVAAWSAANKPGYGKSVILFSYSLDDTITWSQNDVIAYFMMTNSTNLGELTPCLATTGTGKWVLVWHTNELGEPDIISVMTSYFNPTTPTGTSPGSTTPTGTSPASTTPTGTTPGSTTPTGTTPGSTTPKGPSPSGSVRERVWGICMMVIVFVWIL